MSIKLHLFYATATAKALILREDTPWWHLILWDRNTDTFTHGQWMQHHIHADRCALSPDGTHFLYFAVDGQWDRPAGGSYTVISEVPKFDALALYPEGDEIGGGGYFVDDSHYVIQTGRATDDIVGNAPHLMRANSMTAAARTPRAARGFARFRKTLAPTKQPYRTHGGQLLHTDGRLIADFTDLDTP